MNVRNETNETLPIRAWVSLLGWLALASCASVPAPDRPNNLHRQPSASQRCGPPDFPYRDGWLGGDAAYSIPLDPDTSLWLFGDTFVGAPENAEASAEPASQSSRRSRRGARLIHNSIALSSCSERGEWIFDYSWGSAGDGTPRAFLAPELPDPPAAPGAPDSYWWLFDGFVLGEKLYIGLLGVETSESRGALNLPFRFTGVKLARIANFRAPPKQWRAEILPLSDNTQAFPSSALVIEGDYLYLFAFLALQPDRLPRILTRLPLVALEGERPGDQLEYLARSGAWKPGLDAGDAQRLMSDDASEMSVRFHPALDRWLAVYSYPSVSQESPQQPPSDRVMLRTSRSLAGPWSQPVAIFRMPEVASAHAAGSDPDIFCYAAKEHPQIAQPGQLLISYVCNLYTRKGEDALATLGRLLDEMDLYRPRAVSLPLPELP